MRRQFTQEEAHAVFARAARRQEAVREADERAGAGLTLAELQAIGAEVGIDPAHVEAAAQSLVTDEPEPAGTFLGVPKRVRAVRTLPFPLGDAAWTALVDALHLSFGHAGTVEHLGARRTWSMHDAVTSGDVSVRVEGGTVTMEQALPVQSSYASALVPLGLVAFLLLGTFEPYIPALMLLMALAIVLATRLGLPAWARLQETRFHSSVDHVELAVLRAESELREEGAGPGLLSDLDALGDPPGDVSSERDRLRTR